MVLTQPQKQREGFRQDDSRDYRLIDLFIPIEVCQRPFEQGAITQVTRWGDGWPPWRVYGGMHAMH